MLDENIKPKFIDIALSKILRAGLVLSITTILFGGLLLFFQLKGKTLDYSVFKGEPINLKQISSIALSVFNGDATAIIIFGILLMIATPIVRVALCIFFFFKESNYLYVALSCFVLSILIFSLF